MASSEAGFSQLHGVIREQARDEIDGMRRPPSESNAALGARDEEGRFFREAMQSRKVDVTAIRDVDGIGFDYEIVEEHHIGVFSLGNLHDRGDQAARVGLGVELDGRVMSSIPSSRKRPRGRGR